MLILLLGLHHATAWFSANKMLARSLRLKGNFSTEYIGEVKSKLNLGRSLKERLCPRFVASCGDFARLNSPDFGGIFPDSAICRELAGTRHIEDRFAVPVISTPVNYVDVFLALNVASQAGQQHVAIAAIQQGLDDGFEDPRFEKVKEIALDQHQGTPDFFIIMMVDLAGIVRSAKLADLRCRQPEDEDIVASNLLQDFHVSPVEGSDGQRSIELEFHIAGPRGLGSSQRDLFAEIGRGNDPLRERNPVIRQKYHLHLVANLGIPVEHFSDLVNEFDDQFRDGIGGSCLGRDAKVSASNRFRNSAWKGPIQIFRAHASRSQLLFRLKRHLCLATLQTTLEPYPVF
jgi:hypothetical protein